MRNFDRLETSADWPINDYFILVEATFLIEVQPATEYNFRAHTLHNRGLTRSTIKGDIMLIRFLCAFALTLCTLAVQADSVPAHQSPIEAVDSTEKEKTVEHDDSVSHHEEAKETLAKRCRNGRCKIAFSV